MRRNSSRSITSPLFSSDLFPSSKLLKRCNLKAIDWCQWIRNAVWRSEWSQWSAKASAFQLQRQASSRQKLLLHQLTPHFHQLEPSPAPHAEQLENSEQSGRFHVHFHMNVESPSRPASHYWSQLGNWHWFGVNEWQMLLCGTPERWRPLWWPWCGLWGLNCIQKMFQGRSRQVLLELQPSSFFNHPTCGQPQNHRSETQTQK